MKKKKLRLKKRMEMKIDSLKQQTRESAKFFAVVSLSSLIISGPIENGKGAVGDFYTRKSNEAKDYLATSFGYVKPELAQPHLPRREQTWEDYADEFAAAEKLNKCFVRAMIQQESAGCTMLVSSAGAMGCMQFMKATAREFGMMTDADRLDPEMNIFSGIKFVQKLRKQYGLFKALKVYNAGLSRVDKTEENRNYPHAIMEHWANCQDTVNDDQPFLTTSEEKQFASNDNKKKGKNT